MVRWAQKNTGVVVLLGVGAAFLLLVGFAWLRVQVRGSTVDAAPTATVVAAAPVESTVPPTTVDERVETSDWPCEHFRNVAGDVNAGILTDVELREKLKEVRERAVLGTPEVQEAATALLAAATSGVVADVRAGFARMDAACAATGH